MGRTNPTYRDAIRRLEAEWEPMGRALRAEYREDFERLFDRARGFADAAGYANPADPERALVLSLLLAHEVELRRLAERLEDAEAIAQAAASERSERPAGDDECDDESTDRRGGETESDGEAS